MRIEVTDIRLGNLVSYGDALFLVRGVVEQKIYIKSLRHGGAIWVTPEHIAPVQITEEVLRKFGAESFPGGGLMLLDNLIGFAECRNVFVHIATSIELTSAHRLQNLLYELTGKEVTFAA